ncbi:DUF1642 domain-containing protein [Enterococcus sp. LJL99]
MNEIEKLKKDLDLIITKANEYDRLDQKFKSICNKGVQEALQHIAILGLNNTDITEQQALNKLAERFPMTTDQIVSTLEMAQAGVNHEPVEVPEFVADEINHQRYMVGSCMQSDGLLLKNVFRDLHSSGRISRGTKFWTGGEFYNWMQGSDNVELFVKAVLDGYTVTKEPLYIMPVPCTHNGTLHYCLKDDGEISFRQGNAYKFNKDQIKEYFPEIKDLAVPVEEEAE